MLIIVERHKQSLLGFVAVHLTIKYASNFGLYSVVAVSTKLREISVLHYWYLL